MGVRSEWTLKIEKDLQGGKTTIRLIGHFQHCEREFICIAFASLTLEDCIRMHERLRNLLMPAQEPAAAPRERME
jgi:hypothetical protein